MPPPTLHRLFASIVLGGAAIGCSASHEPGPDADAGTGAAIDAGRDAASPAADAAATDAGIDAALDAGIDAAVTCSCGTCTPGEPGCDDSGCAPCIF